MWGAVPLRSYGTINPTTRPLPVEAARGAQLPSGHLVASADEMTGAEDFHIGEARRPEPASQTACSGLRMVVLRRQHIECVEQRPFLQLLGIERINAGVIGHRDQTLEVHPKG